MIALDTNVLVRYLVEDDARQTAVAAEFVENRLSEDRPGFVAIPVLCELAWVLTRGYGFGRDAVIAAVRSLSEARQFLLQNPAVVAAALGHEGDLADGLIHELGRANGCTGTATFDRSFARIDGVELLGRATA